MTIEQKELFELNDRLQKNGQPCMTLSEYRNMKAMKKAYEIELMRNKKSNYYSRLIAIILLGFAGLIWVLFYLGYL